MQLLANYLYLIGYSFAIFVLISLGLAVIFGMMRVINLAQGEFIMLGAYVCVEATKAGLALWLAIIVAGLAVGAFGIVVERLIIRFLYGRILDTLLATWGLSLFLVGGVTIAYGPQSESVGATLGNFQIGDISYSRYSLVVIIVAVLLLVGTYALWRFTRFGLIVRGTMQNPVMANAMGINTGLVYMLTFGFGSALAGLAGAVLVPIVGASPQLGLSYIAKAFITVIAGGPLPLLGTSAASAVFSTIDGIISYHSSTVVSEIAVLLIAIVLLRLLPLGITGRLRRGL
jgi:branched-chain amino acid transport system permease protein